MTFKENNKSFIEVLQSGLRVCEKGSSIDLLFQGNACAVQMKIKVRESLASEPIKKLLMMAVTAWGKSVVDHYQENEDKISIHINILYNEDDTFTVVNSMDADDILNSIKDDE